MRNPKTIIVALLLIALGLSGCASTDSINLSRETMTPSSEHYYCCAMGGSLQGNP